MPELDEELKNEQTEGLQDTEDVVSDDELLSDAQIERIAEMNLDDIIQDATSGDVSVADLFGGESVSELQTDTLTESDSPKESGEDVKPEEQKSSVEEKKVKTDEKKNSKGKKSKKKKGFLGALRDIFFESIEEPNENTNQSDIENVNEENIPENPKDENERVLKEMYGADGEVQNSVKKQTPKKGFFAKFKYRFEQYKKKAAEEDRAEQEAEAAEYEEKQQKKKEKKQAAQEKKEQKKQEKAAKQPKEKKTKPKKEKAPKEPPKPGDILRIRPKSIVLFVLLIAGIVVLTEMLITTFHYGFSLTKANKYLENDKYEKAYTQLAGMELRDSDKDIYRQVSVIMYVQRQYDSYHTFMEMDKKTEALNALIKGMERYDTYVDEAKFLGVGDDVEAVKKQIVSALQSSFSITESEAKTLVELSQNDFTKYYLKIEAYGAA